LRPKGPLAVLSHNGRPQTKALPTPRAAANRQVKIYLGIMPKDAVSGLSLNVPDNQGFPIGVADKRKCPEIDNAVCPRFATIPVRSFFPCWHNNYEI
jgi:hypothetical protein